MFGKKKKRASRDEYFDMDLNNDDIIDDYGADDTYSDLDSPDEYVPVKQKKNPVAMIGKVLGTVAVMAAIIIGVYLLFSVITGPSRKQCKTLMADFQYACNEVDLSRIADCLEPSLATKIKAAIVIGDLTGQDIDDLLKMAVNTLGSGFMPKDSTAEITDVFKTITIEPVKYGLPGKKRVVRCRCSIMGVEQYLNFTVKKVHGSCYIDKVEIPKD